MLSAIRRTFSTGVCGTSSAQTGEAPFSVRELLKNVYQVHFSNQGDLASTFLRFQEYHESPKFGGAVFTRQEFEEWYAGENGGKFTYLTDWSGFNLPSSVLTPFVDGKFDPLSAEERGLVDHFVREQNLSPGESREEHHPFYLIGTYGKFGFADKSTVKHELCHALFHLDQGYNEQVKEVLKDKDLTKFEAYLRKLGYGDNVLLDEINAYVVTDAWIFRAAKVPPKPWKETSKALQDLYLEAYNGWCLT